MVVDPRNFVLAETSLCVYDHLRYSENCETLFWQAMIMIVFYCEYA